MTETNLVQIQEQTNLPASVMVEIDTQIATAKQYPRDLKNVREMILLTATQDQKTAEECYYKLPRKQRQDDGSYKDVIIEGETIRFAEIVLAFWGNIQTGTRVVNIDKVNKTVTVQGVVWDLERNVKTSEEVTKSIATSSGHLYSQDMIIMTTKSASSQALRNAIFRAVPRVMFSSIMNEIKKKSVEGETGQKLMDSVNAAIKWFVSKGIPKPKIMAFFNNKPISEFTTDDLLTLKGIYSGIESGEFSVSDAFAQTETEKKAEDVMTSVENKVSKGKKKAEAQPEQTDGGDYGTPKKRTPQQLQDIEDAIKGVTDKDLETLGLDYIGPKDIAISATSEEIDTIVQYLIEKGE